MMNWKIIEPKLDDGPAYLTAIGLISLASDIVSEPELQAFLPKKGVGLYANRIPMSPHVTVNTLCSMGDSIEETIAGIIPDDHLDVIAYGCTAASCLLGSASLAEKVCSIRGSQVSYSDPILAGLLGLDTLGCQRIALLTPYSVEVSNIVASKFEANQIKVVCGATFNCLGDPDMSRVSPAAIRDMAIEIGKNTEIDAVFISCTALRVSSVLEEIEEKIRKPVISSNQAMAWHCMRLADDQRLLSERGELFLLPVPDMKDKTFSKLKKLK